MAKTFRERLESGMGEPDENGCRRWRKFVRSNGYGSFAVKRADGQWSFTTAHRAAYQVFIGPIPEGYEVDHLCRNRACVNPEHLEAVPLRVNRQRRDALRTHCPHGHPFSPENTYRWTDKHGHTTRCCRTCRQQRPRSGARAA